MAATPQDAFVELDALLAKLPRAEFRAHNADLDVSDEANAIVDQDVRDLLQYVHREVRGKLGSKVYDFKGTELVPADGTSGSTTVLYRMDLPAGEVLLGNVFKRFAALTDTVLIGAGEWGKSYQLDGSAAVVLTADGKTYMMALVALLVNGAVELHAVFGDEDDDGNEVAPTTSAIKTAIAAAGIANLDASVGLVVGRAKIQRVAVDTITWSPVDPSGTAADELALAAERAQGTLWKLLTEPSS